MLHGGDAGSVLVFELRSVHCVYHNDTDTLDLVIIINVAVFLRPCVTVSVLLCKYRLTYSASVLTYPVRLLSGAFRYLIRQ